MDCFASLAMTVEVTARTEPGDNHANGVHQPTEPDPASADETGGRQHAVAGFDRAGAASGAADQGTRTDLMAGYDGRAAGHRFRPRSRRGTQRREAFRQGVAWLAAPGARGGRRRALHSRYQRAELEQGAQYPAAAVRQSRHAVLSPEHGRYRRSAGEEMGAAE